MLQACMSVVLFVTSGCEGGLLGAGTGDGSCAASPYRAAKEDLAWPDSCPGWAECCTEYGYCHPRSSWEEKLFRDCNGESNGIELPEETLLAEAAANGDDIVFPDKVDNDLDQLSQQVEATPAPPLPVLDLQSSDYEEIPLNGLYSAPV